MEVTTDYEQIIHKLRLQLLIERIVMGALALIFVTVWTYGRIANAKSLILVNGKPVACVPSATEADDVLRQIKSRTGCNPDDIKFMEDVRVARAPRDMAPVSRHIALRLLERRVSPMAPRWAIIVNGKPAVALPNKRSAGETLDLAKLKFGQRVEHLAEIPQFKENVRVDIMPVDPTIYFKTPKEAVEALFTASAPTSRDTVYVVRDGDIAGAIASRNGLKLQELEEMNPGVHLDRLQIGDKIRLRTGGVAKPKLTVVVRDQSDRTESVPAPIERVASDQLSEGQTREISQGSPGQRRARIANIYENGRQVGTEVMEEQILKEPVPRRMAVGVRQTR